MNTLGPGSTGYAVESLQEMLKNLGYFQSQITGNYDLSTSQAVSAFQKNIGIRITGIADKDTLVYIAMKASII